MSRQYYRNLCQAGTKGRRLVQLWLTQYCILVRSRSIARYTICAHVVRKKCTPDLSLSQYPSRAGDFLLFQNVHPGSAPTQPCTQRVQKNRYKGRMVYAQKEDC
jgi:hypothetical protein